MGFAYAGNLLGVGTPVVRNFQSGESMYVGQLVKSGRAAGLGGHVAIADIATDVNEDVSQVIGICTGIVDGSSTWTAHSSGTAEYGQSTTYTTTIATVLADGPSEVEVTLIIPGVTLVRAPIYDTTWGTALTELVETAGDANGVAITHDETVVDCADDFSTIYCRTGANRGIYRVNTTVGANAQLATVPFPHAIAIGDTFVIASCALGLAGMDLTTTFDAIDGDNAMNEYYQVYYHDINLEESGKEYAIFSFWSGSTAEAA
jgi:hypothetical protein